jgi:hypothetical protein
MKVAQIDQASLFIGQYLYRSEPNFQFDHVEILLPKTFSPNMPPITKVKTGVYGELKQATKKGFKP